MKELELCSYNFKLGDIMTNNEIKQTSDKYLMPTYGHFDVSIKSGKNATVIDFDNKEYIDFTAGIGVNSLGFGNENWDKALKNQINLVSHTSNLYYTEPACNLAKSLCEKTGYSKVFFANSGAEANECAIKLARKYSFDKYGKNRFNILTLTNSFHGRTMATLSATGQDAMHNYFFPFNDGFIYVDSFDINFIKSQIETNSVCAIMFEFVQGEGGVIPLSKDFLQSVKKICKENDVLLIGDEVQTGVGRTGTLYAFEQFDIMPDILTSAKGLGNGLPIGACLCKDFLGNTLTAGSHGSTFGGNPIVCSGSIAVLDTLDIGFLNEVTKKAEYIKSHLSGIKQIKSIRGMGMMIGLELQDGFDAKEMAKKCVENGLLILTAKTLLRMLPPLTITYKEIDKGIEILKYTLMQGDKS